VSTADDRLIFRPHPRRITFVIRGVEVETDLYHFMDLPVKDSESVLEIENELQQAREAGGRLDYPAMNAGLRRTVRLLCPQLPDDALEALVPRQLQDAINASYGVAGPPPGAEAGPAASPSASAASTTPSPPASTGAPSTSPT
jgi:hypothetical protein